MKLSFCTNFLFTVGDDGHLIIYDVKDKDPKGRRDKDGIGMEYSDEILTLDSRLEELDQKKKSLFADNQSLKSKDGVGDMLVLKKKDEELLKIQEDMTANSIQDNTKMEALQSDKQNKGSLLDGTIKQQD